MHQARSDLAIPLCVGNSVVKTYHHILGAQPCSNTMTS